jgi:hypothetical protein
MEYVRILAMLVLPGGRQEGRAMAATWRFHIDDETAWDWALGPPPVRLLQHVRRPTADAMSRHTPVRMVCQTTGSTLLVESALEYEAARSLDRDPNVEWIVAQPVAITFEDGSTHVADLLSAHRDGSVVLWDVRPDDRQDEEFQRVAGLTRSECASVGWGYEVFGTQATARRLNMMWISAYRRPPRWPHTRAARRITETVEGGATVGDVLALDEGDGHTTATMWHLVWTGALDLDLDTPITADSQLSLRVGADA